MEKKIPHCRNSSKYQQKIVELITQTEIYDRSLSWHGTCTAIKGGGLS